MWQLNDTAGCGGLTRANAFEMLLACKAQHTECTAKVTFRRVDLYGHVMVEFACNGCSQTGIAF